tara:strand:- start:1413 stop:2045 length:633 start_codon:yes stop_codon:yes gene_type:complete
MNVGIIKYGLGNIASVYNALKTLNQKSKIIERPTDIDKLDFLILPGVGNFSQSKFILDKNGWTEYILNFVINEKKPILGICLGMQLLASWGYEGAQEYNKERIQGFGLIEGEVKSLLDIGCDRRIPHMGWNEINWKYSHKILDGVTKNTDFYFVHSYVFVPSNESHIIATSNYPSPITAVIAKGNIWGVQFHPEKSSKAGLKVIKNFLDQ